MKTTNINMAVLLTTILLIAACADIVTERGNGENTMLFPADPDKGLVLVSVAGAPGGGASTNESEELAGAIAVSRTVVPDLSGVTFSYLLFADTEADGIDDQTDVLTSGTFSLELKPAHWTITVKGWEGQLPDNTEETPAAFEGSAEIEVMAGETTPLTIGLKPTQADGATGTFYYTANFTYNNVDKKVDLYSDNYPGALNYALLSVYPLEGGEPVGIIDLLQAAESEGNDKRVAGSVNLPVGYYQITAEANWYAEPITGKDRAGLLTYLGISSIADFLAWPGMSIYTSSTTNYSTIEDFLNYSDATTTEGVLILMGIDGSGGQKYAAKRDVILVYRDKTSEYTTEFAAGDFAIPLTSGTSGVQGARIFADVFGIRQSTSVQAFLANKPQNTADTPYIIGLTSAIKLDGTIGSGFGDEAKRAGNELDPIANLVNVLQGRYVIYDWSAVQTTTFSDITVYDSYYSRVYADRIVGLILPSNLTKIGNSFFYGFSAMKHISLPASLTTIGQSAFYGCSSLGSILLPDSLTTIGESAFRDCSGLTGVDIGTGLSTLGARAFQDCSSLRSIVLPDNVTTLGGTYVFGACSSLTSADMGMVTNITANTFNNCKSLKTVILRKTDSVVTLANVNAFTTASYNTKPDFAVYVPRSLISNYESASNWSTMLTNWRTGTGNSEGTFFKAFEDL
jgi:hypothetical protein